MVVALPVIFFILAVCYFKFEKNEFASGWRKAFLTASVAGGVYLVFLTETLSLFNAIQTAVLAAGWAIPIFLLGLWLIREKRRGNKFISEPIKIKWGLPSFFICALILVVSVLALIGLSAPPNNWDSMVYHMARVVFWMDHQNVAYYPTNTLRQIYQPPFAEYVILNLQVLSGSDRFANLVQWFSMLGSLVGVSLIAKQLGASKFGETIAAVLAATIPMGILQSTSTQNDYVVGFELICFVYFINESQKKISWHSILAAGAALGLAILTKATAYIYAAPFLIWWCYIMIRKFKMASWKPLLVAAVLVIPINFGQFSRNLALFGNPIGPLNASAVGEVEYANEIYTIPALISNLSRNIALHLGTSIPFLNKIPDKLVHLIHQAIRLDVSDPRITYGTNLFNRPVASFHEDYAGNLFHMLLIGITLIGIVSFKRLREMKSLSVYMVVVTAGFILFCFYLRWQPFNSRLHLPWFLLWSPIIAIAFTTVFKQHWLPVLIFGLALLIAAYPWLFTNKTRPLIGPNSVLTRDRMRQIFFNQRNLQEVYAQAVETALQNSCLKIGLYLPNKWEYPIWVYLKQQTTQPFRIKDVLVSNISQKFSLVSDFTPCSIIAYQGLVDNKMTIDLHTYQKVWDSSPISVFVLK